MSNASVPEKASLTVNYTYSEAALQAIAEERQQVTNGVTIFMEYRVTLHMMYMPQSTYLVTKVGMNRTEIVSVFRNNHVWFCTMTQWTKKLAKTDGKFVRIRDPLAPHFETDAQNEQVL